MENGAYGKVGYTYCPNCTHGEFTHAGGACYNCSNHCGWHILGQGNAWGLPRGWYPGVDLDRHGKMSFDAQMGWCIDVDCLRTEPHKPHI